MEGKKVKEVELLGLGSWLGVVCVVGEFGEGGVQGGAES